MRTEILVSSLAETLYYIETVAGREISPEAAGVVYDLMADALMRLDKADKQELAAILAAIAGGTRDPEKAEFLADLPNGLGLTDGTEEFAVPVAEEAR